MSLTAALRTASAALALNAAQSAIVSRNVSNAGDASASAKIAQTVGAADGSARRLVTTRAADAALGAARLTANAEAASATARSDGLAGLGAIMGEPGDSSSPGALLAALGSALQTYAATPASQTAGAAAIAAASRLAEGLNAATRTIQDLRTQTDARMAASVGTINKLLADFDRSDAAVVRGLATGADVTDAQDARDAILKSLSGEIGVITVARADGSLAIYADGGATLADRGARAVSFSPTTLAAGAGGAAIHVDGVAVTGPGASMPIRSGALAGLAALRDEAAPRLQAQLDEVSRGLVEAFSERDSSGAARPGLFTWSGAPASPSTPSPGLAGSIAVSAAADPARGGAVSLLRDGGINGTAFASNAGGAASYSARLQGLADALDATRAFDPGAGLGASASLLAYANDAMGALQAARSDADGRAASAATLAAQAATALSDATGVNLDAEMSHMLDLENAFQASAKLIAAANSMFAVLFNAVQA